MTRDRREAVAEKLLAENIYQVDYIRGSMGLFAVLPIVYGVLTWVYGTRLWSGSDVYKTALEVPWAPQSWGTVFILMGVLMMWSALRKHFAIVLWASLAMALMFSMFMITFGTEYVTSGNVSALPPALAWCIFSLLMLNLTRHSIKMRQSDRIFRERTEGTDPARET